MTIKRVIDVGLKIDFIIDDNDVYPSIVDIEGKDLVFPEDVVARLEMTMVSDGVEVVVAFYRRSNQLAAVSFGCINLAYPPTFAVNVCQIQNGRWARIVGREIARLNVASVKVIISLGRDGLKHITLNIAGKHLEPSPTDNGNFFSKLGS